MDLRTNIKVILIERSSKNIYVNLKPRNNVHSLSSIKCEKILKYQSMSNLFNMR